MASKGRNAAPGGTKRAPGGAQPRRTLQRLRKEAGYKSARGFAKAVGIPETTYCRYERQPETPETAIPMGAAWRIADMLGVSIDLVVGRADVDAPTPQGLLAIYRGLSRSSRELLDEYVRYLVERDERAGAWIAPQGAGGDGQQRGAW